MPANRRDNNNQCIVPPDKPSTYEAYRVFKYAITLAFSSALSSSSYGGIPLPPLLITSSTVASVTFFPLVNFACLYRPFREGPIFFSSVSVLWQAPHCSKVSLPFVASPAPAFALLSSCAVRIAAVASVAQT